MVRSTTLVVVLVTLSLLLTGARFVGWSAKAAFSIKSTVRSLDLKCTWGCEKDAFCQEVVRSTYGICMGSDIFDWQPGQQMHACCVHGGVCPWQKSARKPARGSC